MYCIKILLSLLVADLLSYASSQSQNCTRSPEVDKFREYLTINTTPGEDFSPGVYFWRRLAADRDIEIRVYNYKENYPIIVLRFPGSDPSLPSILLISHMDVAPANYKDGWSYPPFSAHVNGYCEIIGRGTQVMKSVSIQHYEAMSRFKKMNETLPRDVYMIITPDATLGSSNGLGLFVKTEEYRKLNAGLALGVGGTSPNLEVPIFHQDRTQWVIQITCYGRPTHSALLPNANTTAIGACGKFFANFTKYREEQYNLSLTAKDFSEYTTINLIGLERIFPYRVVPAHVTIYYAVYLAHNTSLQDFNNTVKEWAEDSGDICLSTYYLATRSLITNTDCSNPYWETITEVLDELNIPYRPATAFSTTDLKFVADTGIPALGFSPIQNTTPLMNSIDERLSIQVFLRGITIYGVMIRRLANIPQELIADDPAVYLTEPSII